MPKDGKRQGRYCETTRDLLRRSRGVLGEHVLKKKEVQITGQKAGQGKKMSQGVRKNGAQISDQSKDSEEEGEKGNEKDCKWAPSEVLQAFKSQVH